MNLYGAHRTAVKAIKNVLRLDLLEVIWVFTKVQFVKTEQEKNH